MSLEQIILLVLFVVVPLVQTALRALKKAHAAPARSTSVHEPTRVEIQPEEWVEAAPDVRVREAPLFALRPPAPVGETAPTAAAAPRSARKQLEAMQRAPRARILPRSRAGLRDALALTVILGPPRALDRGERQG